MSFQFAISKIEDGNMAFNHGHPPKVLEDRQTFFKKHSIIYENTVCIATQMRDNIITVDSKNRGAGLYTKENAIKCDALITKDKNINLFLNVADCLPIIIHDPMNNVISLIHAGWPDTDLRICQKVIDRLKEEHSSKPEDLEVLIGPGITKDSLIYDKNIFNKITTEWGSYIKNIDTDTFSIDNPGFTIHQLLESGIQDKNIKNIDIDTYKDRNYFSHVRDYREGREKDSGRFCMICKLT